MGRKKCKHCRYKFKKEIKDSMVIIRMIDTRTKKEKCYARFYGYINRLELQFIYTDDKMHGHGTKMIRLLKAIARERPIYIHAMPSAVGFFQKQGFIQTARQARMEDFTRMVWKPII